MYKIVPSKWYWKIIDDLGRTISTADTKHEAEKDIEALKSTDEQATA